MKVIIKSISPENVIEYSVNICTTVNDHTMSENQFAFLDSHFHVVLCELFMEVFSDKHNEITDLMKESWKDDSVKQEMLEMKDDFYSRKDEFISRYKPKAIKQFLNNLIQYKS